MRATDGIFQSLILRAGGKGWPVPAIVVGSIFFVAALSLFLFVRRATGALTAPLATPQLIATAMVMCLWALVVREFTARRATYFWVSLVHDAACRHRLFVSGRPRRGLAGLAAGDWLHCDVAARDAHANCRRSGRRPLSAVESDANPEHVLQQLTRFRTADGKDAIRGTLVAEFVAGERQTTVYVGFCPPFELLPQVEANATGDFEAEVKLAQVLHNGAQLDVRLSEPAEEAVAVSIEFFASEGV